MHNVKMRTGLYFMAALLFSIQNLPPKNIIMNLMLLIMKVHIKGITMLSVEIKHLEMIS